MALTIGGKASGKSPKPEDKEVVQSIAAPNAKKVEVTPAKASELTAILKAIQKDKGDNVVVKGNSIPQCERIATGVFEFDLATGGGFPRSRYSIVYGPESSGKTNIAYCAAATAQRLPPPCNVAVWVDLEGTFDPDWAAYFGVDVEALVLVKPAYGEEAVDLIDALIHAEEVAFMAVDSLAVVVASKEVEQSVEKFDVGTAAILVKRLCNKLVIALSLEARRGHRPAVVLINQTRMKIGVMFGDPETMPGGQTMKFLSSLTVRLYGKNKMDKTISPELPCYKETKAVIKKAKVPVTRYDFDYEMGLLPIVGVGKTNSWNTVLGHLKDMGVLSKTGAKGWQLYGMEFPTLIPIQQRYEEDHVFRANLHAKITESQSGKFFLVEASGAAG